MTRPARIPMSCDRDAEAGERGVSVRASRALQFESLAARPMRWPARNRQSVALPLRNPEDQHVDTDGRIVAFVGGMQ